MYVVSDDELLHMQVSLNNEISEVAIRLLSFQDNDGNHVKEVRCNSGRIWFHFPTSSDFEEEHVDFLARRLLSHLKAISDSLMKVGFRDKKACKDPFILKAAVILAISSGLFFNGLAQSYRINLMDIPFTIDTALLRTDAIIYGSGILAIMVLATFYILGRSARTHLVLIELLLFGTAGVGLTMHAQLRDLNMDMDISAITEHAVHVYSKKKVGGRRSTSYYMNIDDWTDEQRRRKVEISGSFYAKISTGDKVLVQQRDGYLGYRWVENLTRL